MHSEATACNVSLWWQLACFPIFSREGRGEVPLVTDPHDQPRTLLEAGRRVWLETLNLLAEYGTLVVFSGLTVAGDVARRQWHLPAVTNAAVIVAEVATVATMVLPKAIRAVGEVIQVLGIVGHDAAYALRHGTRRPKRLE